MRNATIMYGQVLASTELAQAREINLCVLNLSNFSGTPRYFQSDSSQLHHPYAVLEKDT
jgi:hypothetical protein